METLTKPEATEKKARVGGHSTIHTRTAVELDNAPLSDELPLADNPPITGNSSIVSNLAEQHYFPANQLADNHEPLIPAFETDSIHAGPPRHAGKVAVAFGIAIVLVGGAAAVSNVINLVQNPPSITLADSAADGAAALAATDAEAEATEAEPEATASDTGTATVLVGARIRSGPDQSAGTVGSASQGGAIVLTGQPENGGWYPVSYNGIEGWVWGDLLTDINYEAPAATDDADEPEAGTGQGEPMVVAEAVRFRAGPARNSEVIKNLPVGAHVEVTGEAVNGWVPVIHEGQAGWTTLSMLRHP
jgi:uncharacterized protein YraI